MPHRLMNICSKCAAEEDRDLYEIGPVHSESITELVTKRRFKNKDDFINRAIEVFLAWERNPTNAFTEMQKVPPTLDQFAHLINVGYPYKELQKTYPNYPEKWGDEWLVYLSEHEGLEEKWEGSKKVQDKQNSARASLKDFEKTLSRQPESKTWVKNKNFESIEFADEFTYDGWPVLITHYSRIFPARVGVLALGHLMRKQNREEINFEDFKETAYDLCEEIAMKQRKREVENEISKEYKISTGLPKPYLEDNVTQFQIEYQNRYKERYFGKIKRNRQDGNLYFEGLMSALGLIKIFKKDNEERITFTEQGKMFYLFENPMFEYNDDNQVFSKEERKYIIKNLISQRKLEIKIYQNILNILKEKNDLKQREITDYLDEVVYNTVRSYCEANQNEIHTKKLQLLLNTTVEMKDAENAIDPNPTQKVMMLRQTPMEAIRIAIMGRMSELNLVNWEMVGLKSNFTLGDEELISITHSIS